jgi:voltage-dependent potassium channel beta subunit
MEYRFLGNSGLKVSVLSYGGWLTLGNQIDIDATAACMKAAYDAGINFFDTAEQYSNGDSERAIGEVLKKFNWKRSSLVISTKIYWGGDGPNDRGLSRKHLIEGLNASLDRLGLDYVDLVFAHRPDDDTPMEEVVRAFNWLIEKGKAFYWGTSEWSAEQLSDAWTVAERLGLIGPVMEQPQYNMFCRDRFEQEYAPLYVKRKLGTTIWSPLAGGLLTGKYNKEIPADSRFGMLAEKDGYINLLKNQLSLPEGKEKIAKVEKLMVIFVKVGNFQAT